jgi:hypothetical protein
MLHRKKEEWSHEEQMVDPITAERVRRKGAGPVFHRLCTVFKGEEKIILITRRKEVRGDDYMQGMQEILSVGRESPEGRLCPEGD